MFAGEEGGKGHLLTFPGGRGGKSGPQLSYNPREVSSTLSPTRRKKGYPNRKRHSPHLVARKNKLLLTSRNFRNFRGCLVNIVRPLQKKKCSTCQLEGKKNDNVSTLGKGGGGTSFYVLGKRGLTYTGTIDSGGGSLSPEYDQRGKKWSHRLINCMRKEPDSVSARRQKTEDP